MCDWRLPALPVRTSPMQSHSGGRVQARGCFLGMHTATSKADLHRAVRAHLTKSFCKVVLQTDPYSSHTIVFQSRFA